MDAGASNEQVQCEHRVTLSNKVDNCDSIGRHLIFTVGLYTVHVKAGPRIRLV